MKRYNGILLLLLIGIILIGCKEDPIDKKPIDEEKPVTQIELISDPSFSTGFNVLGYSPVEDGRQIKMKIDYNGTAKPSEKPLWYMAQWWTPYNLVDSSYHYEDGKHIYQTKSRTIEANPNDGGYLRFELLGSEEYFGGVRTSSNQPWAHLLIEQTFTTSVKVSELKALNVHLEFTVEKCVDKNGNQYNPSMHAAQYLWYFTLQNRISDQESFEEAGKNGDFLWFGVPLFDSRFDFINQSAHIDSGAAGTTNKLIYSISSKNYFDEKIIMGKTYTIDIDILPYLKEAFIYAINNNALVNCQFTNMEVGYMNFGWELPGSFDVASTIRNMSALAVYK